MEKHKSFSFKSTKFLLLFFTLSFSLILLTFLSYWSIKATPSFHKQTHLQLNNNNKPLLQVQTLTGFGSNFSAHREKDPNSSGASLRNPNVSSGFVEKLGNSSGFDVKPGNSSEVDEKSEDSSGFLSPLGSEEDEGVESDGDIDMDVDLHGNELTVTEVGDGNLTYSQVNVVNSTVIEENGSILSEKIEEKRIDECDVSRGRWVFEESYPLYTNSSCPFIDEGFNCLGNGRLDKNYLKWRWQPHGCDIPRFNATKMLELIRGKRLVFVGDSINRNQWESLLCLLMGAIQDPKKVYETRRRKITKGKGNYCFRFVDYQCTLEFYVTHFLVHESKARIGSKRVPTLQIDRIDRGTARWRGADILIFNTANWWTHSKTQAGINYYQEGSQVHAHLEATEAFRRALRTWALWVDRHVNPQKTRVFFRSSAPSHFRGGQWNAGGHCKEAIRPLDEVVMDVIPRKDLIVTEVIKRMRTPVTFLNVTAVSSYRIDGHPSVYGGKSSNRRYSSRVEDCSHWCLPGVPDTWNELLYYHVLSNHIKDWNRS
ncbi:hypothetical protein Drorol1_Dr00003804 [Drosera rotundifolia]